MAVNKYDTVILGSGLGGLLCGAILAKKGFRVCVLEKHHQIGGNLQTFKRGGVLFNSAMHYVGSMDQGQVLQRFFSYLGIQDRTGLEKLDPSGYERIYLKDSLYELCNGIETYRERLLSYFPKEGRAIHAYLEKIQEVWNSTSVLNLQDFRNKYDADTRYTQINAYDYIESLTTNRELKALWGITSALYAGIPERSPLITHAIIAYHYIQSAYKFTAGTDMLASALEDVICRPGGEVVRNREVVGFEYSGKLISAVNCMDGSRFEGSRFISGIHPASLVKLIEPGRFRKAYVSRIEELENTIGSFGVYIKLKGERVRNIPSNVFISSSGHAWSAGLYEEEKWPAACILYTNPKKEQPEYAESMVVSAFMKYSEVEAWKDSSVEKRGEAYRRFKREKAEALFDLVESKFPGLRSGVEEFYTASPLTLRDYTGMPEGSIYGILKDCNNPRRSYISAATRIPNLFLTGQNSGVGLHGVLGVSISSLFTCANFIDIGKLLEEIRNG